MRISYYMPFKPLGHGNPSGDLIIGTELYRFLKGKGHAIELASTFRTRWIYYKPWLITPYLAHAARAIRFGRRTETELWLTYHTYYKAPDVLGPLCARRLDIPYVIFQGMYSTKRRKKLKTWAGFVLNRLALMSASFVFTNKKRDFINLRRIIAENRLKYIGPGINREAFKFNAMQRSRLRKKWRSGDSPVVLSAAMFRSGVKTRGLEQVIRSCARLINQGIDFQLVVVGDGEKRRRLKSMAGELLSNHVYFAGRIPRQKLYQYYSAADLFVFPGIEESLGMVYLEAQGCGLPVVAFKNWGAKEAVLHGTTGLLSDAHHIDLFEQNLKRLILNEKLRNTMGSAAEKHISRNHDLEKNYAEVEDILLELIRIRDRKLNTSFNDC